jgi:hypothetical protein
MFIIFTTGTKSPELGSYQLMSSVGEKFMVITQNGLMNFLTTVNTYEVPFFEPWV